MNQEKTPFFSIITVNRNDAAGLERTVQSVLSQDFMDREYIIVDGGSTDASVSVIKRHEQHVSFWSSGPDRGIYDAMNKGIAQAHGRFLIFMNAGDHFHDGKVLSDIAAQAAPGKDMIISGDVVLSYGGGRTRRIPARAGLYDMPTYHQSMFFNRDIFARFGGYDIRYRFSADFDLCQKTACVFPDGLKIIHRPVSVNDLEGVSNRHWPQVCRERLLICRRNLSFPRFLISLCVRLGEWVRLSLVQILKMGGVYRWVIERRSSCVPVSRVRS